MNSASEKLEWLRFHAGLGPSLGATHQPAKVSVTQQFRPYTGRLDTALLRDVVELARAVELGSAGDKDIRVSAALALWVLTNIVERWVLDAGGMLQRNNLIQPSDTAVVRKWVSDLHDIGCQLLEGH